MEDLEEVEAMVAVATQIGMRFVSTICFVWGKSFVGILWYISFGKLFVITSRSYPILISAICCDEN